MCMYIDICIYTRLRCFSVLEKLWDQDVIAHSGKNSTHNVVTVIGVVVSAMLGDP